MEYADYCIPGIQQGRHKTPRHQQVEKGADVWSLTSLRGFLRCRAGKLSAGGETVVGEGMAGLIRAEGLTTGWWRGLPRVGGTAGTTGLMEKTET